MADVAVGGRAFALPASRVEAREWLWAHRQELALAAVVAVAFVLRFWDLGSRALHHDESLHAQFSYYLYDGNGYKHDPLMHGPFLFHISAAIYFLFGASDYTARIAPALFGTALVAMPWLLRKQIGYAAVLASAVLLCFSPTLLYFSRFDRNEAWMVVWTFAIVICIWRYLDEQRDRWLFALAAVLALSFASKEVTFITVAIILLFVDLMLAVELGRRREGEQIDGFSVFSRTVLLVPVAWLIAAMWPLISQRPFGRDRLPLIGDVLVVLGTLSLPQYAAGIQVLPFVGNEGYFPLSTVTAPTPEDGLRVTTVAVLLIMCAYVGLLWKPKVWATAAAFFYVPYVLLYTTFFTNQPGPWTRAFWDGRGGFFSGIWGSLDYWLDQHHVKRGNQPVYYYTLLTPLYEFLPLLLALGGGVWMALKGDSFKRWLLFWFGGIFIGLSIAGEKMPWLEAHIALPLALIGGVVVAKLLDDLQFALRDVRGAAALAAVASFAVVLMLRPGWSPLGIPFDSQGARYVGYVLIGSAVGWVVSVMVQDRTAGLRGAAAVAGAVLLTLTVRAGTMASLTHGDIPVEMLVYTQTSPDIPRLRDRIDALAKESGLGYNLPIVVDATDGFSWPWAWYLRDYHDVQYPSITQGFRPPENAVLLIAQSNVPFVDSSGYTTTPYKHRWWFIEESYRDLTPRKLLDVVSSPARLEKIASFWLYRRADSFTGSVNAVAYFPDSLSGFDVGSPAVQPAPEPVRLPDGRIVIGASGVGPGLFTTPADVFVAPSGEIYVADSRNNRIQKFDQDGRWLASAGGGGSSPGRFSEPWSVAVDNDGFVYVADTWNHRIQKLDRDLKVVKVWGEAYYGANPGPFQMFGPRDIAIGPDRTLWVTDTGNKRIANYTRDGDFIRSIGSPGSALGQLDEAVSIAFDSAGGLWVTDNWNERLQRFAPGFAEQTAYAAGWSNREAANKPYLAVLTDGRVVATDPARGTIMLFDLRGPVKTWRPSESGRPVGVAPLGDGGFVFSDALKNEVQIVPAALIDRLFR